MTVSSNRATVNSIGFHVKMPGMLIPHGFIPIRALVSAETWK